MEKRVRRVEASVMVGAKDSPKKSPNKEQSTLGFVDPNSLAQKYGVAEKFELVQPPPPVFSAAQQRSEVDMLRKLEEKNRKIDQLCVLLEALEPAPGVDPERIQKLMDEGIDENVDFRDAKIVSLAKKSHRLTQQLNKEKTVTDKLNQQILELQKTVGSLSQELQMAKASSGNRGEPKVYNRNTATAEGVSSAEDYLVKIAGLTRDVKEGAKHIEELKRKLAQSTDEAKQLSRALAREIGEGVTVEDAVSGGWRGRAQQIIMLKNKIKRLEANEGGAVVSNGGNTVTSGYGRTNGAGGSTVGGNSTFSFDVDRKAEEDLQAMSNDRRQIVEALTEERAGLMEANQHLEKRNTAQKARIQNLEGDVRKLKDSLQMVLDKSSTDDQLLDALREEVARMKAQSQQQHQHHAGGNQSSSGSTFAGRSYADGISSKFLGNGNVSAAPVGGTGASSTIRSSGQQVLLQNGGRGGSFKGGAADSMADSLDFLQSQQAQQQEGWEAEQRQMQAELQRLRRQVKNQAEQLETQDVTIRQLKKKLDTDFKS